MKKLIAVFLVFCLCAGLFACGTTAETEASTTTEAKPAEPTSPDAWIYGSWSHNELDGKGDSVMDTTLPVSFTFDESTATMIPNGSETPITGTYTIDDINVVCQFEGQTIQLKYLDQTLIYAENPESRFLIYLHDGYDPGGEEGGEPITIAEAESIARDYARSSACKNKLLDKANCHSMEFFEISSVTTSNGNNYRVTIKGNFFGNDDHGVLKGHYAFTVVVPVSKTGRVLSGSVSITVTGA